MQLYGVIALAPSVARLKNLGALEDRSAAVQELCAINRCSRWPRWLGNMARPVA